MRRFLIWSALAAIIGLALAGGGFWAYQHFYARFQPVTITRNQPEIQRLLDEASWVSAGGGGEPLYVIAYRDSAAAQRYEREEFEKLRAAGIDARIIVFARKDREGMAQSTAAERATVAELWLSRDWSLYERWTATPARNWTAAGIPAADGNMARGAVVEASRDFVDRLNGLLREAGVPTGYPIVLWRDRAGFLKACACSDSRSWTFIRDDLDAPDAVSPPSGVEPGIGGTLPGDPLVYPGDGSPETGPYPTVPGAVPPATGGAPAPRRSAQPANPPAPKAAPQAQQQEDTTFF